MRSLGYLQEKVLEHFERNLGVSFPHRFEKGIILEELKSDDVVVDIGCGVGQTTLEFAEKLGDVGSIIGIDFSPKRINEANRLREHSLKRDCVEFRVGKAEMLEIPDSAVTLIISQEVLLHIIDKASAIKEMYRILKLSGRAIVSSAALSSGTALGWDSLIGAPIEWLPIGTYESLFTKCGFKIATYEDLAARMRSFQQNTKGRVAEARFKAPRNWCYPIWKLTKD